MGTISWGWRRKPFLQHTCELEDFGSEVLQDGGGVHSGLGTNADVMLGALFEVPMDTTDWELGAARSQQLFDGRHNAKQECGRGNERELSNSSTGIDRGQDVPATQLSGSWFGSS